MAVAPVPIHHNSVDGISLTMPKPTMNWLEPWSVVAKQLMTTTMTPLTTTFPTKSLLITMQDSNPPLQAFKWKNAAPLKMKNYFGIATKRKRREMETNNEYGKYFTLWIILSILICFLVRRSIIHNWIWIETILSIFKLKLIFDEKKKHKKCKSYASNMYAKTF